MSAAGNIIPLGITWDGTSVLVLDSTNDAVWGFTQFHIFGGSILSAIQELSGGGRDTAREGLGLQGANLTVTAYNDHDETVYGEIIVAYDGSSFTVAKGSYTSATERDIFVIDYG